MRCGCFFTADLLISAALSYLGDLCRNSENSAEGSAYLDFKPWPTPKKSLHARYFLSEAVCTEYQKVFLRLKAFSQTARAPRLLSAIGGF